MELEAKFDQNMFDETERPGELFPLDTHQIIRHRYDMVLPVIQGRSVLEVGAGHGLGARILAQHASRYVAGEFSDQNIELFKRRSLNCQILKMDAHQMPFSPGSFDVVVALAMIYYLDFEKFLDQVRNVLTSKGKLFFCTSNKDVPGFVSAPYTTDYFSVPELNRLLRKHGFECEFKGAFRAQGGNYYKRKIRATLKNTSKALVSSLPMGEKLWKNLRKKSLGALKPLPWNVDDIQSESVVEVVSLDPTQVCDAFRIIYGVATKTKQ